MLTSPLFVLLRRELKLVDPTHVRVLPRQALQLWVSRIDPNRHVIHRPITAQCPTRVVQEGHSLAGVGRGPALAGVAGRGGRGALEAKDLGGERDARDLLELGLGGGGRWNGLARC